MAVCQLTDTNASINTTMTTLNVTSKITYFLIGPYSNRIVEILSIGTEVVLKMTSTCFSI